MRNLTLSILLLSSLALGAAPPKPAPVHFRQHYQILYAGTTYELTELLLMDEHEARSVTLLATGGRRYVFTRTEDYRDKKLSVEARDAVRGVFLRGSYKLPYKAATRVAAQRELDQLPRQAFVVPFRIETNLYSDEHRIDKWHKGEGAAARTNLLKNTDAQFVSDLQAIRAVLTVGAPAGHAVCNYLLDVLAPGQSCRTAPGTAKVELEDNCAFDARFGYPCEK